MAANIKILIRSIPNQNYVFTDCTILEYYTDYFHPENVIYVYFSPRETGIPSSLKKHAEEKLTCNIHIGYIVEDQSCLLTQLKRNHSLLYC